jgi:hypothetical protein
MPLVGSFCGAEGESFRKAGGRTEDLLCVPFALRPAQVRIDLRLSAWARFPPGPEVEDQGYDGSWVAWPRARLLSSERGPVCLGSMQTAGNYAEGHVRLAAVHPED